MDRTLPLTVVVPVYNEGANIHNWWTAAQPHLPAGCSVRVVYDFDEDDTLPVVRELARHGAPIAALRNVGKGVLGAILTGLQSVEAGPVLVSMADLSDDLAVVPSIIAAYREGADLVVASRYMRGGRQLGGPWLKGHLARFGGLSLRWIAGFPVSDATNSFRLYDAALVKGIEVESPAGFVVGFEITVKAWMSGARIVEVPSTWRDRVAGESRFDLKKWLPHYARLWRRAMGHGLRRRLTLRDQPSAK